MAEVWNETDLGLSPNTSACVRICTCINEELVPSGNHFVRISPMFLLTVLHFLLYLHEVALYSEPP